MSKHIHFFAFVLGGSLAWTQTASRHLTLDEAIALALKNNSGLKIQQHKVEASGHKADQVRAEFFPQLSNESNLLGTVERQRLQFPAGAFGVYPQLGPLPAQPLTVLQGGYGLFLSTTTLAQPLTQLIKLHHAWGAAQADTRIAEQDLTRARNDVAVGVQRLYCGILIARLQSDSAALRVKAAEEDLGDTQKAVESGSALEVAAMGKQAAKLEDEQAVLATENQISDLAVELNNVLGLPLDTELDLAPPAVDTTFALTVAESTQAAVVESPEVLSAAALVEKAERGLRAARAGYVPDVSAFVQHIYQDGVPLLSNNNGVAGLKMEWKIFDFGKRRDEVAEREAELASARENLKRTKEAVAVDVEKAWRKVKRAEQMMQVADEALKLRREMDRLAAEQLSAGVALSAARTEAKANLAKAEADALAAGLGYRLARAELDQAMGRAAR
jgi:outer membrane protein TolC